MAGTTATVMRAERAAEETNAVVATVAENDQNRLSGAKCISSLLVVRSQFTPSQGSGSSAHSQRRRVLAPITLVIWATCAGDQPTWWVARLRPSFSRVLLQ
jgi:hypothetical protein